MSRRDARTPLIEVGGEPRISFLPPEIQERKDAHRRRRSLFMLILAIAVLCAIGYVYAAQYATGRKAALEAEQQVTLDLLAEQATYTEARGLAKRVELTHQGIKVVSSTEVFWRQLIGEITAAFPPGVHATQWTTAGLSSLDSASESSGLFPVLSSTSVDVSVLVGNLKTVSVLLDNLSELPGVVSVGLSSVTADDNGLGTTISIKFDSSVDESRYTNGWEPSEVLPPAPIKQEPSDTATDPAAGDDTKVDEATTEEGSQ